MYINCKKEIYRRHNLLTTSRGHTQITAHSSYDTNRELTERHEKGGNEIANRRNPEDRSYTRDVTIDHPSLPRWLLEPDYAILNIQLPAYLAVALN